MKSLFGRKNVILAIFAVSVTVFWSTGLFAQTVSFPRNLKMGDSGADIRLLQQILNRNPVVRVAEADAGSPGLETTYFGPKTRSAVVRFQELYADEILAPAGLTVGTGFVGPLTRAALNRLAQEGQAAGEEMANVTATPPASSMVSPPAVSRPIITGISPTSGKTGTVIIITGSGFSSANEIYTGFEVFKNVASADGKTLTATINSNVPVEANSYVPDLPVYIYVKNFSGRSEAAKFILITE